MKTINIGCSTKLIQFETISDAKKFYSLCEHHASLVNFRGDVFNWSCFCKGTKFIYKPIFKQDTGCFFVEISILKGCDQ